MGNEFVDDEAGKSGGSTDENESSDTGSNLTDFIDDEEEEIPSQQAFTPVPNKNRLNQIKARGKRKRPVSSQNSDSENSSSERSEDESNGSSSNSKKKKKHKRRRRHSQENQPTNILYDSDNGEHILAPSQPLPSQTESQDVSSFSMDIMDEDDLNDLKKRALIEKLEDMRNNIVPGPSETKKSWAKRISRLPGFDQPLPNEQLKMIESALTLPLLELVNNMIDHGVLPQEGIKLETPEHQRVSGIVGLIKNTIRMCIRFLEDQAYFDGLKGGSFDPDSFSHLDMYLFGIRPTNNKEPKDIQVVTDYVLNSLYKNKYRKSGSTIYKQKTIEKDGAIIYTRSWEPIHSDPKKSEIEYEYSRITTETGSHVKEIALSVHIGTLVKQLTNTHDHRFPFLELNRYAYSFKNGVYFTDTTFGNKMKKPKSKFVRYEDLDKYPGAFISNSYKDIEFDDGEYTSWKKIKTPLFDKIFKAQKLTGTVLDWIYVMTGRLLHELRLRDNWQVALFLKGIAGSGKSAYGNVVNAFFPKATVKTLNCGNFEQQFGFEGIVGKWFAIIQETAGEFGIPQDVLQQMIVGESISVPIKHQRALDNYICTTPLLITGNVVPNWDDNSGAMDRRLVIAEFERSFTNDNIAGSDQALGEANLDAQIIKKELDKVMRKCNEAYLEKAIESGEEIVWSIIPNYFKNTKMNFRAKINSLLNYLRISGHIEFVPDGFIYLPDFKLKYINYCNRQKMKKVEISTDENLENACRSAGLTIDVINEGIAYGKDNKKVCGKFLKGVRFTAKSF
jgi:phage/plasmid-associated DNA primase